MSSCDSQSTVDESPRSDWSYSDISSLSSDGSLHSSDWTLSDTDSEEWTLSPSESDDSDSEDELYTPYGPFRIGVIKETILYEPT